METKPLQLALAIFGFVTAFATTINNFVTVSGFIQGHFATVFTIASGLAIIGVWPQTRTQQPVGFNRRVQTAGLRRRYRFVIILALTYLVVMIYFFWETKYRVVPGAWPYPSPSQEIGGLITPALAGDMAEQPQLTLVRFGLASARTTFVETSEQKSFSTKEFEPGFIKTFMMDRRWFTERKGGECMEQVDSMFDGDMADADVHTARAWKKFLETSGKQTLLPYIDISVNHGFVGKRPDIVRKMIPSEAEWKELKAQGPDGTRTAKILLNWIKYCVGIRYPTFEFIVQNQSKDVDVIITKLSYDVQSIGGYRGGEPGVVVPLYTYDFDLPYSVGSFEQNLEPAFVVPGGKVGSFLLKLHSSYPDLGLGWRMRIGLVSASGTVWTDQFQLLMSGEPKWAEGDIK
ncbi:hypothetical protein FHT78_002741 [Rhizobium sp. BK196]|uniref:hypothetical protein n=1 Tax=Rhizobium sp. BK196 TaxID=2587073 RepID=UPI00161CD6F7|nr:hypothetical protein [Rhizobium sp. BK196]MBB3310997.1 hypothetical protein [Rhizobium sp. BK196]